MSAPLSFYTEMRVVLILGSQCCGVDQAMLGIQLAYLAFTVTTES